MARPLLLGGPVAIAVVVRVVPACHAGAAAEEVRVARERVAFHRGHLEHEGGESNRSGLSDLSYE